MRCRGCDLRIINTQLYHLLPQLRELDFGENSINYLPKEDFSQLKKLKHMYLDGNRLAVLLPGLFKQQAQLSTLHLANNRLVKIAPKAFDGLNSIRELNLSGNQLDVLELPVMEPVIATLQSFDVSGNHLDMDDIRPVLQNMHLLTNIRLSHLKLVDLPLGKIIITINIFK